MKMRKYYRGLCGVLAGCLMAAAPSLSVRAEEAGYIRATTYTSDAWVSNFWNTESDHMEEELAQIAADGFNTIILVIPWREFQPSVMPLTYNPYAFEKLDQVMEAAEKQGLSVMFRVGYTWDYYGDESSVYRFRELLRSEAVRNGWLAYAGRIYETGNRYSNFCGGFMTWEDFWNYAEDAGNFGRRDNSRKEAKQIGFQDYLKKHYTLSQLNEIYQPAVPFSSYSDVYIPGRSDHAYRLFYEFYDAYLEELLADTQKCFPGLSMEVRLDADPVPGADGEEMTWVSHFDTFDCGDADYTALMYSVSMGRAAGQTVLVHEALRTMGEQLAQVKAHNGGKPIMIDQLLYMDETEAFQSNARLLESHRGLFLMGLPDILRRYTNGYGIWTYRNYTNNPVYNSQFALGSRGWEVSGAAVQTRNGSSQMMISPGGKISQKIGHRIGGRNTHDNYVRFTADSDSPAEVTVTLGTQKQQISVDGEQQFTLEFGRDGYYSVEFETDGEVYLDNIQVYNFIQDGQLRDVDGNELSCMAPMRHLNRAMQ